MTLERLLQLEVCDNAWNLATTVGNGTSGFRACGIFPYDPQKIPEHAFKIASASEVLQNNTVRAEGIEENLVADTTLNRNDNASETTESMMSSTDVDLNQLPSTPISCTSHQGVIHPSCSANNSFTPFDNIVSVPTVKKPRVTKRKQHAHELTSFENREKVRKKKTIKEKLTANKNKQKSICKKPNVTKRRKLLKSSSESSEAEEKVTYQDSSSDMSQQDYEYCAACSGYYYAKNGPKCDWIISKCCKKWTHEDCAEKGLLCA
ncbi:hypothetical protein QE152_g904 [Popillia japonica]|uniref:Uncharacterized protein n=1 Tax=Popillia japonica TaxID=7064 RepID=A0AAW1N4U4_POPJA